MPKKSQTYWRHTLQLTGEEEELLKHYLARVTLFWNCCVQHLNDAAEAYIASKTNPLLTKEFTGSAWDFYNNLRFVSQGGRVPEDVLETTWYEFIPSIFELSDETLRNRLSDLLAAYMKVKRDMETDSPDVSGMPKRKTDRSSESVRFSASDFTVSGTTLQILRPFALRLSIPELTTFGFNPAECCLSITRKPPSPNRSRFGPQTKTSRSSYTLTLRIRSS